MKSSMSLGFSFQIKDSKVIIFRGGSKISVIGGKQAMDFINIYENLTDDELQQRIARLSGNYKRGNERLARNHYRNRKI